MHISTEFIERMRLQLETLHREIAGRSARIEKDIVHRDEPLNADSAEQVVELENFDVLNGLYREGAEVLQQIDDALSRIDSGDYGICKDCGKNIPQARLEAVPHAIQCVDCA